MIMCNDINLLFLLLRHWRVQWRNSHLSLVRYMYQHSGVIQVLLQHWLLWRWDKMWRLAPALLSFCILRETDFFERETMLLCQGTSVIRSCLRKLLYTLPQSHLAGVLPPLTLKVHCHAIQWFLRHFVVGKNNGGRSSFQAKRAQQVSCL